MNESRYLHLLILTYLALALCASSAPIPSPAPPPLGVAESSLTDSIRSFESAFSQLDDKISIATAKRKIFTTREKWIGGLAAGVTTLGSGGFIASPAIPMWVNHREAEKTRELRQAVDRANTRKALEHKNENGGGGVVVVKRTALERFGKVVEDEGESFVSALSRTSSRRMDDFKHENKGVVEGMLPKLPFAKEQLTGALSRSNSAPLLLSPRSKDISQSQLPPSHGLDEPSSPLRYLHRSTSISSSLAPEEGGSTHERLSAVEAALLDLKQHQHDQQQLSPLTKVMIGLGLVNAVAAGVSAELGTQNAVENAIAKRKGKNHKLPDVSNLDKQTCESFEIEVTGLDCSKAHG